MTEQSVWNASLSTMWAMGNRPDLEDFLLTARHLGFAGIELNHQVDSAMLSTIDLSHYAVSSIHEPCPADIPIPVLKARDWLISATNERDRKQGVATIKRSIDLAGAMGVRNIIVHAGNVRADWPLERQLFHWFKAGRAGTPEFLDLRNHLVVERAALAGPNLESVKESLVELLDYSRHFDIRLGLENRYHFMDIPTLDEMDSLIGLAGPDQVGFWYDVGHAQALERLGFFPHRAWLQQYAERIVGVHLHDVVGIDDHDAPGKGEVDFSEIAGYLPAGAVRTLELRPDTRVEQIAKSLQFLAAMGCIQRL